jgi:hypothetical protein
MMLSTPPLSVAPDFVRHRAPFVPKTMVGVLLLGARLNIPQSLSRTYWRASMSCRARATALSFTEYEGTPTPLER